MIESGNFTNYDMLLTIAGIAVALWAIGVVFAVLVFSKRRSDRDLDRVSGVIRRAFEPFSERPSTKRNMT